MASAFPLSPDKQQYVQAMAGDIQVKLWERNSTMLCTFLFFSRSPSVFPSRSSFPDSGNGCPLSDMLETRSVLGFESGNICIYSIG